MAQAALEEKAREQVRELIERIPVEQVPAVVKYLKTIVQPPFEDEEIGEDEERAVAASKEWLKHNAPIPMMDILADFGLSMDDFERMGQEAAPTSTANGR